MSKTAAAPASAAEADGAAPPAKKGKKKLIIIIAAALLLAAVGGGAAIFLMKKKAAEAAAAEEVEAESDGGKHGRAASGHAASSHKVDVSHPPVFVPLEPFVVNLADRESDRYAQIAVTLQVEDAKFAEQMKAFMPAIRNSILMVLAHKTSHELLERAGKEALAQEIMREAVRPMGIEIDDEPEEDADADKGHDKEGAKPKKKKGKAKPPVVNPIQQVHFANFIIQ